LFFLFFVEEVMVGLIDSDTFTNNRRKSLQSWFISTSRTGQVTCL